MRINDNTCLVGENVLLVPYKEYHVPKYHDWMKSEELQHQTASEPLSLDEEYAMQRSWHLDENKCTFIILDKKKFGETEDEIVSMIGDTNLFFSDETLREAEAEIMIAERSARGKRRGWEAMLLMLRYGIQELNVQTYEVKIKFDNSASICMFSKIGFSEVSRSDVFEECTLRKSVTEEWTAWLSSQTKGYQVEMYDKIVKKVGSH